MSQDSIDELTVETQVLDWLQYAGKGLMMERLFRLQRWGLDKLID
jgi:hypothetical protein